MKSESFISIEQAISKLLMNYKKAIASDYVQKPISWALYQTWKEIDRTEKSRKE